MVGLKVLWGRVQDEEEDQLESDHGGIERHRADKDFKRCFELESDHGGIERFFQLWLIHYPYLLESDHGGIESNIPSRPYQAQHYTC